MQIKTENDQFRIIVKPNSNKNEVICFDKERKAYKVNIKAPAERGKANIEVIKFCSKLLKKKVSIVKALTNREKILKID